MNEFCEINDCYGDSFARSPTVGFFTFERKSFLNAFLSNIGLFFGNLCKSTLQINNWDHPSTGMQWFSFQFSNWDKLSVGMPDLVWGL